MKSIAVYYKIHEGIESSENYDEKQKRSVYHHYSVRF